MKTFPVVHVKTPEQAALQTQVAVDAEADGVFLIHHGRPQRRQVDPLIASFNRVTDEHPDLFVGMNFLALSPLEGYRYTQRLMDTGAIRRAPNGLWFDDATDFAGSVDEATAYLEKVAAYRDRHPQLRDVKFLGGVSFKYTDWYTDDPELSARMAEEFSGLIDVVTTSGAGTGFAPSAEKISAMSRAAGPGKLAVASGISIENLQDYKGQPDMTILVASSLETELYSGEFIPEKVREFVQAAHRLAA